MLLDRSHRSDGKTLTFQDAIAQRRRKLFLGTLRQVLNFLVVSLLYGMAVSLIFDLEMFAFLSRDNCIHAIQHMFLWHRILLTIIIIIII